MAAGKLEVTTVIRSKRSEKLWVVGEEDDSEWLSQAVSLILRHHSAVEK
jgi:RNA:NAD 2'-phosphotransferase (TPT1/KptA family)